jgi:hypothetical protein
MAMAILVEHLQGHPVIIRFVVVVVEDHRLKARTHIATVEGRWPTSLDEGRGTADGDSGELGSVCGNPS